MRAYLHLEHVTERKGQEGREDWMIFKAREYWEIRAAASDRPPSTTYFGKGYGPVVRQTDIYDLCAFHIPDVYPSLSLVITSKPKAKQSARPPYCFQPPTKKSALTNTAYFSRIYYQTSFRNKELSLMPFAHSYAVAILLLLLLLLLLLSPVCRIFIHIFLR